MLASQCRVDTSSTSSPRIFCIYCTSNFSSPLTHTISYVEKYCIHIIGLVCKAVCGVHFLISPDYYQMINRSYLKLAFIIKPLILELNVQGTLQMTEVLNGNPSFWMVWVCDFISLFSALHRVPTIVIFWHQRVDFFTKINIEVKLWIKFEFLVHMIVILTRVGCCCC